MLVTFPQAMSATDHFNLHRFGEVELAVGGRQFQPTNFVSPVFPFDDNGISSVADVLEPDRICSMTATGTSSRMRCRTCGLRDAATG